jgi:hypothetical protein
MADMTACHFSDKTHQMKDLQQKRQTTFQQPDHKCQCRVLQETDNMTAVIIKHTQIKINTIIL